jgi:hypothetical protein
MKLMVQNLPGVVNRCSAGSEVLHNFLIVLAQIANKMGLQRESCTVDKGWLKEKSGLEW